ncbi:Permease of the drug/metabolite transporter (DMT) superfamily [Bosea sp. OK403]|uniref:DMT family transporter n=1 Tax=Bosea sp. OK403 TaxID=1855286 RepID=UPI0008E0A0DC|nr:DMT family transporter [Bosea sp. OK403]SFJ84074.1 Permease of the drug/metabolite transporter (DMT) superfamily [Bosea sp. OK403]
MHQDKDKWLGTLLIVASAIAYSLSGYFTRLVDHDVWTILFWRGIFGGVFLGAYIAWRHRPDLLGSVRAMGWAGLWVTILSATATICFINALRLTPVADIMTIHAAIPFMTAILALVIAGEKEDWTTWAASIAALAGVAIIVNPQASAGHLAGYAFAMVMALSYAAMMVVIRKNRHVSMLPAACLSAFLCAVIALPFASPAHVTAASLFDLLLFGTVQFGLGLLFMTTGTRLISATRSALIGSMENPLAPLWVWLAFSERPSLPAWIGGSIVMTAVIVDVLVKSRRKRDLAGEVEHMPPSPQLSR